MKRIYFYQAVLLFFLCQFTVLFVNAQANQPVIAYITIVGTKTGTFKGGGMTAGNEGKIECIGFRYSVSSPHNVETGMITGKRAHTPFVIIKNIDSSTPQLLQAAYDNEILKSVIIEFYKRAINGRQTLFHKVTLTNASITLLSQYGGTASPDKLIPNNNPMEEVSLTFQKIEFENTDGKTTATDSWNVGR